MGASDRTREGIDQHVDPEWVQLADGRWRRWGPELPEIVSPKGLPARVFCETTSKGGLTPHLALRHDTPRWGRALPPFVEPWFSRHHLSPHRLSFIDPDRPRGGPWWDHRDDPPRREGEGPDGTWWTGWTVFFVEPGPFWSPPAQALPMPGPRLFGEAPGTMQQTPDPDWWQCTVCGDFGHPGYPRCFKGCAPSSGSQQAASSSGDARGLGSGGGGSPHSRRRGGRRRRGRTGEAGE